MGGDCILNAFIAFPLELNIHHAGLVLDSMPLFDLITWRSTAPICVAVCVSTSSRSGRDEYRSAFISESKRLSSSHDALYPVHFTEGLIRVPLLSFPVTTLLSTL